MGSAFGSLCGAQLAGRLIHTYGSKMVSSISAVIMPLGLIGIAYSGNAIELFLTLFVLGLGYSSLDISVNTQAVAVEKLLGRRWMSSFHALWSSGAFVTTVLGGSIARHTTPQFNLVLVGLVSLLLYIPAVSALLNSHLDDHDGGAEETQVKIPLIGRSVLPLWAIGIGLFGALIAEGAASDWGAIFLRDHMGIAKVVNASAFASFSLTLILSSFFGDRVLSHFVPAKTCAWVGTLVDLHLDYQSRLLCRYRHMRQVPRSLSSILDLLLPVSAWGQFFQHTFWQQARYLALRHRWRLHELVLLV